MEAQRLIYSREEKLVMLAQLVRSKCGLPRAELRVLADLLFEIELCTAGEGCRASHELLGERMDMTARNVRRLCGLLQVLGLLQVERQRDARGWQETNRYLPQWSAIDRLGQTHTVTEPAGDGQTHTVTVEGANGGNSRAEMDVRPGRKPMSAPGGNGCPPKNGVMGLMGSKDLGGRSHSGSCLNTNPIDPMNGAAEMDVRLTGGWGRPVTVEVLSQPAAVQELFQRGISRGWLRVEDRLLFFTAAASVLRRKQAGSVQSVGGAFTQIVKRRLWGAASQDDELRAKAAIQSLDAPVAAPKASCPVPDFGRLPDEAISAGNSHREQLAKLAQRFGSALIPGHPASEAGQPTEKTNA